MTGAPGRLPLWGIGASAALAAEYLALYEPLGFAQHPSFSGFFPTSLRLPSSGGGEGSFTAALGQTQKGCPGPRPGALCTHPEAPATVGTALLAKPTRAWLLEWLCIG